jgi:Domain of unknown function (DUF1843)
MRPGPLPPYGTAINDAIQNPKSKLADLTALRDHTQATIAAQGDLEGALKKLDAEIKKREKAASAKK